jgi:two-component system nitrogen regulation response regulator GlnG
LPLIGRCPAMQDIYRVLARLTQTDLTVMITGESGTGKELVARALHEYGKRRNGPFVAINMAAIPRELIESELFGHERGSFTGAVDRKEGKFELAENGTIFLDEISTMDERTQINLLRVLESFAYMRIGGKKERQANVRVVAATNRDLQAAVAANQFREDLYFRLNVVPLRAPPLRERPEDIPLLCTSFLELACRENGMKLKPISPEALAMLAGYPWPGNVRELRNAIEHALVLGSSSAIAASDLPETVRGAKEGPAVALEAASATSRSVSLPARLDWLEKQAIEAALRATDGKRAKAAELLGIDRATLYKKLVKREK